MLRRMGFLVAALLALAAARPAAAQDQALADMVLGKADAPVTIIEYASMTCPHCANFHATTLPQLKSEYIDTGKVRLVFRDFPFDELALRAAMLARCGGPDRFFGFVDMLFRQQQQWAVNQQPLQALGQIARLGGIGDEQFRACLADRAVEEYVLRGRLQGQNEFGVNSTPSFVIAGTKYAGYRSFDEMKAILDPLLAGSKPGDVPLATPAATPAGAAPQPGAAPAATGENGGLPKSWIAIAIVIVAAAAAIFFIVRRRA